MSPGPKAARTPARDQTCRPAPATQPNHFPGALAPKNCPAQLAPATPVTAKAEAECKSVLTSCVGMANPWVGCRGVTKSQCLGELSADLSRQMKGFERARGGRRGPARVV
jgi:hypothetical protein